MHRAAHRPCRGNRHPGQHRQDLHGGTAHDQGQEAEGEEMGQGQGGRGPAAGQGLRPQNQQQHPRRHPEQGGSEEEPEGYGDRRGLIQGEIGGAEH